MDGDITPGDRVAALAAELALLTRGTATDVAAVAKTEATRVAALATGTAADLEQARSERAIGVAQDVATTATDMAVKRAILDNNIAHRLDGAEEHLRAVNGSQLRFATALEAVEKNMGRVEATLEKICENMENATKAAVDRAREGLSKRQVFWVKMAVAATLVASLISAAAQMAKA